MMAFETWKFSEEVTTELEEFLNTVEQNSIPDPRIKSIFQKIHQINETIQIQTDDSVSVNVNECTQLLNNTQIIDTTQICHDISVMNITCSSSTTNADVNNFIEFIEENLEEEDATLTKSDLVKLNEYSTSSLIYLFNKLSDVISDQGLFNLNHSFCVTDINITNIVELFCRNLLLPKLLNSNFSQILQSLLKEISESHSQITRTELLVPLLLNETSIKTNCLQFVINILPDIENQYFLRDFMYTCNELELWQFETIQNLLKDKTDNSVKRRLITLLEASCDKFSNEKLFLKLVIKLIQNLGGGFNDDDSTVEVLHNIIEKNKTLLRISAQKALKEWNQKYNN